MGFYPFFRFLFKVSKVRRFAGRSSANARNAHREPTNGGWNHGAEVLLQEKFNGNKLFEDCFKKGAQRKWGAEKVVELVDGKSRQPGAWNQRVVYGQQDDVEQYTRKHSLEIHGIPENLYTATDDVVIKLGERLDVPIPKEEIDISHKLYNGKNHPKSIIVKFINYKKKAQLYRKRTELKNVKISDLFSTCSVPDVAQSTRIFINENLTQYRRKIMKKAN